jgi:hypothetical protein
MDDIKLTYSKDWRNPSDFPSIETDEEQVRADMQLLYSEIQTFLNDTLIPAMSKLETPSFENLPTEDAVSGSRDKIPTSLAVAQLFASSGNIPAGGEPGQFLVKRSEAYGDALWETRLIPKKLSDLTALDENGAAVNAQTLVADVADQARSHFAEKIFDGAIGFGDTANPEAVTVDLGDATSFERIFVVVYSNPDGSSNRTGRIYLGEWNGKYSGRLESDGSYTYTPSTAGMCLLANLTTYGFSLHTHGDLAVYPFRGSDEVLAVYEQDRQNASSSGLDEVGPQIFLPSDLQGVNTNKITIFARSSYNDKTNDGTRNNPVMVYGIRRGSKEG